MEMKRLTSLAIVLGVLALAGGTVYVFQRGINADEFVDQKGGLEVTVTDEVGLPQASAEVIVTNLNTGLATPLSQGSATGVYSFTDLRVGPYSVTAILGDNAADLSTVNVVQNETVSAAITVDTSKSTSE